MRIVRTKNQALLREIAIKPRLWEAMAEDNGITRDTYYPDMDQLVVLALFAGDGEGVLHGFMVGRHLTHTVVDTHIIIDPDHWGDPANVELGKRAAETLLDVTDALKLTASIPKPDTEVLRFAQRLGFQREGINKQSFQRNGEVIDQYYVGYTRG